MTDLMSATSPLLQTWSEELLGGEKCQHLQNNCDVIYGQRPQPYLLKARFIMVWVLCHQRLDGDEDR